MKKPKICFVTSFFHPVIGGVESHVYYLAKEFMKMGYDIEVFTSDCTRDAKIDVLEEEYEGIKIRRFKSLFRIGFGEMFMPKLFSAVKNSDADLFHVHVYRHSHNFIAFFTKKPSVLTPHWPIYRGQRKTSVQMLVDLVDISLGKYIMKKFKKIFVITGLEIPWVESFGVNSEDISLAPNAIPSNYFKKYDGKNFRKKYKLSEKDLVMLTMSRIHESKGIDQVINLAKFFPKVKFIIGGKDGGARDGLENLISKLNLKNIIFTGMISEREKLEAYAGSDIFCSPSHYEGFCISILEAMSQECAVITSDRGGMPWVVGKDGLVFKDNNLNDFKKQFEKIISNKKIRENFQKKGLEKSKNFKWKKTAEIINKEYEKLINPINLL